MTDYQPPFRGPGDAGDTGEYQTAPVQNPDFAVDYGPAPAGEAGTFHVEDWEEDFAPEPEEDFAWTSPEEEEIPEPVYREPADRSMDDAEPYFHL